MTADLTSLGRVAGGALDALANAGRISAVWREGMLAVGRTGLAIRVDWIRGPCLARDDAPWLPDLSDLSDPLTVHGLLRRMEGR